MLRSRMVRAGVVMGIRRCREGPEIERGAAVQADATPDLLARVTRYGDVNRRARLIRKEPPGCRRGAMAENSSRPTGKESRHPTTLGREVGVADGVDPTVDRMQATDSNAMAHTVLVQASLPQLPHRNHAMLLRCDRGHSNVRIGALVAHIATKAPGPADSPLRPELGAGQKVHRRGEPHCPDGDRVAGVAAEREEDHGDRADRDDGDPGSSGQGHGSLFWPR